jgi:hypothetical protein
VQAAAHKFNCLEDLPTGVGAACPAAVLSYKPLVVSVPLATSADHRSGGTLLEELLAAQPTGPEREDGWRMSPKGPVAAAVAAALADAVRLYMHAICLTNGRVVAELYICATGQVGPPFDASYMEPLQTVRTTGPHAPEHHHDLIAAQDLSSPWVILPSLSISMKRLSLLTTRVTSGAANPVGACIP